MYDIMIEYCEKINNSFISSDQEYAQTHKIEIKSFNLRKHQTPHPPKKICLCREKMTDKKKIREKAEMFENYYNRNKYG